MRRTYMDANATTPLLPEVLEAMRPYFIERFGNASSIHGPGQQARAAVERARDAVAALLHCRSSEIVFTSGGTESDNLALFGILKPGDHLITSSIEHHAILHAAERLAERGIDVTFLPVNHSGRVRPEDLLEALRPNTRLVSIMLANNETGVIQPIPEIGRIIAEANVGRTEPILLHTDAVQAAIKRHGIRYPVAQDNEYATWNAYHNQYWPAQYIIDRSGKIVFEHAGEGQYQEMERKIQELLNVNS